MTDKHPEAPEVVERNATLDDEPAVRLTADELQESILEDSGLNEFQKFCARMSDKQWKLAQRVVGALLGLAAGLALFWEVIFPNPDAQAQQSMLSIPLLVAIAIALIVPNVIEKQGLRRAPQLRIALVIALALVLVIYIAVVALSGGFAA